MDKDNNTVKAGELNKLTKKTYWIASIAILLGAATVAVLRSIEGSPHSPGISLGSIGIILGIISLILATIARIMATTDWKRRRQINFIIAKVGLLLSTITIIVLIIAWVVFIIALFIPNPAND